jgi:catechol 2,3-dioxygenase-like lactoylglutathione lyase family enzyme
MEPRISLITLGVADLDRAQRFYDALGWSGQRVADTVFYQAGPLAIVLWPHAELAADANLTGAVADGYRGSALAHNVGSAAEVDTVLAAAVRAGGTVTRPAETTFYGGYAGYFTDPDGHSWEVAHNPGFTLTEDGALVLPDFGG